MRFETEQALATSVISILREWGWEIYQEVQAPGGRCDIVAVRGNLQWAIECKKSFGLPVIEQAYRWLGRAHYVSVATQSFPSQFGGLVLMSWGIGSLVPMNEDNSFREQVQPRLNRKIIPFKLHEEQKTWANAGTNGGGYYTPFRRTVKRLVEIVRKSPGIEFNQLIKECDHHYQCLGTAKSCLRGFIGSSVVPELRCEIVGGKLCVFVQEDQQ